MSKRYFSELNYTLANEDTSLEHALVEERAPRRALSVCGSGGRALPLLGGVREELVCADLSAQQLLLADLRRATIAALEHEDFLRYWGFPPFDTNEHQSWREQAFARLVLDDATRAYFAALHASIAWAGLLYEGKWERTFTGVPRFLRRFVGARYDEIFQFTDLARQTEYFERALRTLRWTILPSLVLHVFGNAAFFNAFLYKGHFAKKNVPESHYEYYRRAYRKLFFQGLCRENFFLQLSFLGRLRHPEGNPLEARAGVFAQTKAALGRTRLTLVNEDLLAIAERAERAEDKFDFVSLSDVPSYFSPPLGRAYLQRLARGLRPGALVVVRCYLHVPAETDLTGYVDVTERYTALVAAEKTQIYYTFIYEYRG
jgi:S-adenosylmethionine-diacylglycerol 3-amino-3-carboxypropyl transferase